MKSKALSISIIPLLALLLLLAGCSGKQSGLEMPQTHGSNRLEDKRWVKQALFAQFKEWQAVPHRSGGLSKRGIDCSGFVYLTYLSRLGIKLPRSSDAQSEVGFPIDAQELSVGDLVFFKTGIFDRHVGIYLDNRQFLHVSTRKGVMISSLDDGYWSRKYWKAMRLFG